MSELSLASPAELLEIERFIEDIAGDVRHPINDQNHPQHHECLSALHDLLEMADSLKMRHMVG